MNFHAQTWAIRRGRFIGLRQPIRVSVAGPVMLSAAKHLSAHRDRPFAALRVTTHDRLGRSPGDCVPDLSWDPEREEDSNSG